ncbi:hypothetical protein [Franconibacter helveticus]|uniref:hypothetical protein n=1 Tax=Franconibacter helveticus TaxID=357240 RepID=UPI000AE02970|nr:hypothetical protein [Franconibacter helveticus]
MKPESENLGQRIWREEAQRRLAGTTEVVSAPDPDVSKKDAGSADKKKANRPSALATLHPT